jgi:hypothetical protein
MKDKYNDEDIETNQFFQAILKMANEQLKRRCSLSISNSLEKSAVDGYHVGSIAPFGYSVISVDDDRYGHIIIRKKLIRHSYESNAVKTLFKLANKLIIQGKFSYTAIARILNEKGLNRRKSMWNYKNVKTTLTNTRYAGVAIYGSERTLLNSHKKPIKIECLPIVAKSLFNKVNSFISENGT